MIACTDTGSMDGIWGKNAGRIVHGSAICTEGRLFCINMGSMDDSGGPTCADIGSMDDSGGPTCIIVGSMDDLDARACINTGLVDDGAGKPA